MRFFRTCLLFSALGYLSSGRSASAATVGEVAPADIKKATLESIENLMGHRFERLEEVATETSRSQDLPGTLAKLAAGLPAETPKSIKLIGYNTAVDGAGVTSYFITYEFEFSQRWALMRLKWQRIGGKLRLDGFNIQLNLASVEKANAFTFNGNGVANYLVVCLAVIGPLLKVYAFVRCLLTKALKWKLLWLIFIVIGIGSLSVDWTTGNSRLVFIAYDFLGASMVRSASGAWIISVSLPLGALVFLYKLRRMRRARAAAGPAAARA